MAAQHVPIDGAVHVVPGRQHAQTPMRIAQGGNRVGENKAAAPGHALEQRRMFGTATDEIIAAVRGWTQHDIDALQFAEGAFDIFDGQRRTIRAQRQDGVRARLELLPKECVETLAEIAVALRREREVIAAEEREVGGALGGSEDQHAPRRHGGDASHGIAEKRLGNARPPSGIVRTQARFDRARRRPFGEQSQDAANRRRYSHSLYSLSFHKSPFNGA